MRKKVYTSTTNAIAIMFSVTVFVTLAATIFYFIFRFSYVLLILLIATGFFVGALVLLMHNRLFAQPIKQYCQLMKSFSLLKRPDVSLSPLSEIRLINRFVRKTWLQAQHISLSLFKIIELCSMGIFYNVKNEEEVYCSQKFFDIGGISRQAGFIKCQDFDKIYNKITGLYYDNNYQAYLLADFRWVQIQSYEYKKYRMGFIYDVTERVREIKKIESERDIDSLTGLFNRVAFTRLAENLISDRSIKTIAVIMWDINKLKYINDAYGHDVGDSYLCKFAEVIKNLEYYGGLVSRRSGDEFLALIYGYKLNQLKPIIDKINQKIADAYIKIGPNIEKLRASYGVAWYPENGRTIADLINYADAALYEDKYYILAHSLNDLALYDNAGYIQEFNHIIENKLIVFSYQPIIDAKKTEIFGHDAVMRIYSDIISQPKQLREVAKAQGKLNLVEEIVFEKCNAMIRHYKNIKTMPVFINSYSNIILPDNVLSKLFANSGDLKIVVDIAYYLSTDRHILQEKIKILKKYNLQICISNILFNFIDIDKIFVAVDYIKIDVTNIDLNDFNKNKIRNIISFARENNIKVIAKGVDTYKMMKNLLDIGIDYLQGAYIALPFSRPVRLAKGNHKVCQKINQMKIKKVSF